MTAADARHISAHAIINEKCRGSVWAPPCSRQNFIAVVRQVLAQREQTSMHAIMSSGSNFIALAPCKRPDPARLDVAGGVNGIR